MDNTPPSKAILFLAFQTGQNKHKGPAFQTVLRFLPTQTPFHPKRVSISEEGNTQYTPNNVKNNSHTSLVFSQWRIIDFSCAWHKKHLFAKTHPLFWIWSKVRTFPHEASQAKKLTFGGSILSSLGYKLMSLTLKVCKGTLPRSCHLSTPTALPHPPHPKTLSFHTSAPTSFLPHPTPNHWRA